MDDDNRWRFFNSTTEHSPDCECHHTGSKGHGDVCFIPNKGPYVKEAALGRIDWSRQQALAFSQWSGQDHFSLTNLLPLTDAEAFARALRISKCRVWCIWHGQDYDHNWCYPPMTEFSEGSGI